MASAFGTKVIYDYVSADEVEDAHQIEVAGYPEDEAGSLETFRYRQSVAPKLFLGVFEPSSDKSRALLGYICSTLSPDLTLTHSSMSNHIPGPASQSVCIHSVCVSSDQQRKGLGTRLLREYVKRLESGEAGEVKRILLIVHEELRGFYEGAGFEWVGKSEVVHGSRPWFEMRKVLSTGVAVEPASVVPSTHIPPGLWEALQNSSARSRPVGRLLSTFANGTLDVGTDNSDQLQPFNKYDLLCPRAGCGSVILKSGVGRLVERASIQLEPHNQTQTLLLSPLPDPPNTADWWLVTPNPMQFENIGFSKAVGGTRGPTGRKLKLLACAECDLGPLGWCEEGGSEFWLACSRVGYRA
ncbi:hypothetical protein JAAARDRAFT_162370 [Jaapia argillacea MUCL 33604]|uniref:N-acetyltransferase domain-containing protein n=1 Tax=Jaapia argillacea MUCL 33604 TaxID=933084 RepID=A0A067PD96_9AGAM|nr:hypothetical protein JAAARDRAFT_162370 [Jaapia argillacea MUCL 33604]